MRKVQIALVCNSAFGTDGISMFVMNNHRFFGHESVRYHLIYSSTHSQEDVVEVYVNEFQKNGDGVAYIPKGKGLVSYAWELYHYLRNEKIDVLHVHGSSSSILLEMVVAKLVGVKKIVTHSHNTQSNHNFIHKILRPAVSWLADEKLACGDLAGRWMYGKKGMFVVIPNCIDTDKYRYDENIRKEVRASLAIDDETFVIGHVGVFTEIKNQIFLLHLLKRLKDKDTRNYKILFVGYGSLMERVKDETARLELTDCVMFLGNRNDVHQLMMAMDVFCLPSLYEGFPIVSVESQASGLPSLLSENISPEVCLTDLVRLLPIDKGTEAWETALERLSISGMKRDNYARKIFDTGYDISHSALMLEKIYAIRN